MILLGKKQLNDTEALKSRRDYLIELLNEPRPSCGPSSQEWVSAEFYSGHQSILQEEVNEIDARLKQIRKAEP